MPPRRTPSTSTKPSSGRGAKDKKVATQNDEEKIDAKQLWMASEALSKAKAARNFHQLERDKICAFWEITKREIEAAKAEIRNKERIKAEMEERHQVEMKVYKQIMRHVLYEQKVQIANMKLEAERTLKNKEEEHVEKECALSEDFHDLKCLRKETEVLQRSMRAVMKSKQDKEFTEQLKQHEREMKELHLKYDKKIKSLREEMESRRKHDIAIIERRKEAHIEELRQMHSKAFGEIRDFFGEITSSNLETIKTHKEEMYSRKKTEAQNEKAMFEIAQQNKRMTEPLQKANDKKKALIKELQDYERDRGLLQTSKKELRTMEQKTSTLRWEVEVLSQRFSKLEQDRDLILAQFNDMQQSIQQRAIFKRVLLHRKLEVVQNQLERKEVQLNHVMNATGMVVRPAAADGSPTPDPQGQGGERTLIGADGQPTIGQQQEHNSHNNQNLIEEKQRTVLDLQQLLAGLTLKHEKTVKAYETYLKQNGVSGLQVS